jgi:chromatin remodeling complex protein RSC6
MPKKAKKPAKKATKKKATKAKSKRKPNAAFMRNMNIGTALQPIVGSKPMPRTQVVKKLWEYIKKNKLQDKKERRNINADANLQKVFGGKKTVSMFEMTKLVSKHLS